MTAAAKKTATRKPAAKKPAARGPAATRRTRKPRVVHPMTPAIRELGAAMPEEARDAFTDDETIDRLFEIFGDSAVISGRIEEATDEDF